MIRKGILFVACSILLSGCSVPQLSSIPFVSTIFPPKEVNPELEKLTLNNSIQSEKSGLTAEERVNQSVEMTVEEGVDESMNEFSYIETHVIPVGKRVELVNEQGNMSIVGSMKNSGTNPVKDIRQEIHIADKDGKVLYKETVRDQMLEPNEIWTYRIPLKIAEYPTATEVSVYDLSFFSVKMNDVLTIANKEYTFITQ